MFHPRFLRMFDWTIFLWRCLNIINVSSVSVTENTVTDSLLWENLNQKRQQKGIRVYIKSLFFNMVTLHRASPSGSPRQRCWAALVQIIVLSINSLTVWQGQVVWSASSVSSSPPGTALWLWSGCFAHIQRPQIVHRWHGSLANCKGAALLMKRWLLNPNYPKSLQLIAHQNGFPTQVHKQEYIKWAALQKRG